MPHVRYWHIADVQTALINVRFEGNNGHDTMSAHDHSGYPAPGAKLASPREEMFYWIYDVPMGNRSIRGRGGLISIYLGTVISVIARMDHPLPRRGQVCDHKRMAAAPGGRKNLSRACDGTVVGASGMRVSAKN